jgi:hypothetical protein
LAKKEKNFFYNYIEYCKASPSKNGESNGDQENCRPKLNLALAEICKWYLKGRVCLKDLKT